MHALFYESLCVEGLSHFHTQLQVLAHEAFKPLCALRLALFLIEHIVVVLDYLLDRAPELLDHFRHVDRLLADLVLHVLDVFLSLELLLLQLLLAGPDLLLGVAHLLLGLSLEVFGHPLHLLDQEVPVVLLTRLLGLGSLSRVARACWVLKKGATI